MLKIRKLTGIKLILTLLFFGILLLLLRIISFINEEYIVGFILLIPVLYIVMGFIFEIINELDK